MKTLLTSRKFWAMLLGLLVLILAEFDPQFELDVETAVGFIIIIVSYILGVAVDPGPGGWVGVIKSRKFWAACVGLLLVLLHGFGLALPPELSSDVLVWVLVTIGGYIGGVALEKKLIMLIPGQLSATLDTTGDPEELQEPLPPINSRN